MLEISWKEKGTGQIRGKYVPRLSLEQLPGLRRFEKMKSFSRRRFDESRPRMLELWRS
jgi:hypothetical protein